MGVNRSPFVADFKKGGNLYLYLLAAAFVPVYLYLTLTGRLAGIETPAADATTYVEASPTLRAAFRDFVLAGRLLSAVLGVVTLLVTYAIATRRFDKRAGLVATGTLSVTMGFITAGKLATEDMPALLLLFATLGLLTVHAYDHNDRALYGAAATFGLAVSAKAISGMLVVPVAVAIYRRYGSDLLAFVRATATHAAVTIGLYLLTTPSIFVYPGLYVAELTYELSTRTAATTPTYPGWLAQTFNLAWVLGLPLFVLAVVAVVHTARRFAAGERDPFETYAALFVLPYGLVIGTWDNTAIWYILPFLPILAVLVGGTVRDALDAVRGRQRAVLVTVLAAVFLFSAVYTGAASAQFADDPRVDAADWLAGELPENATVDLYTKPLYQPALPDGATVTRYELRPLDRETFATVERRVRCRTPTYIVTVSSTYRTYLQQDDDLPAVSAFYRELLAGQRGYDPVRRFGPRVPREDSVRFRLERTVRPETPAIRPTVVVLERRGDARTDGECA
jgi:4-amino-4-deoxy-L-arabinose transferase-like glycosyltransferase